MAEEFNTQLVSVTSKLLKEINVPFTKIGLKKTLTNHPFFPSLLSLSDTIKQYEIYNRALKIEIDQLEELPTPFFAFIHNPEINTEDFVCVTNVSKESVEYYYSGVRKVSKNSFISAWESQIVLLVEPTNESKESRYIENSSLVNKTRINNILLAMGFAALFSFGLWSFFKSVDLIVPSAIFLLFTLFGLSVSVLLLIFEIDKSNKFVKNICTTGVKTNCDAILSSSASKIFGISWAEIGFYYFSAICLYLMVPGIEYTNKINVLSILSVLTALYIPFSLSYQYFVIKQWCKLCLFVQLTLLLQFTWVMLFGHFTLSIELFDILLLFGCTLVPLVLWNFVKPFIKKSSESDKFKSSFKRLISRQDIFERTLSEQPSLLPGWEELGVITKGNPHAKNTIFKVCSPACHYCNLAHEKFNNLLAINKDIKIVTLYNVYSDSTDERRLPVSHFLALAEMGDNVKLHEAMNYWYLTEDRNYATLISKFPINQELLENQKEKIDKMREWCDKAEVYYTPTIYFNGKRLPASYEIEDLYSLKFFDFGIE